MVSGVTQQHRGGGGGGGAPSPPSMAAVEDLAFASRASPWSCRRSPAASSTSGRAAALSLASTVTP
ncbi:unnamed protein product, partial [Ectocarpus sp. 12 AP-2014]